MGDLAYWPAGNAFCIFFGRTPPSHDDEPRPASPIDVIGNVTADMDAFKDVPGGARMNAAVAD